MTPISSATPSFPWQERASTPLAPRALEPPTTAPTNNDEELREVFDQFVGETFYGQMLASMRKSLTKPAYFHGGRGEEVFQGQLDQVLTEKMSRAGSNNLSDAMFELFQLNRNLG